MLPAIFSRARRLALLILSAALDFPHGVNPLQDTGCIREVWPHMKSCGLISGVQTPSQGNLNPPKWAVQSWQFSTQQGILGDVGCMTDFHPVHPANVGCQIGPFPCQPLDVLLQLPGSSHMEDIRRSGRRDVNPWEFPLHARPPLATHQVAPGNNQGLGRSPLSRPRKKKQWMLFWFNSTYISQNDNIHWIT